MNSRSSLLHPMNKIVIKVHIKATILTIIKLMKFSSICLCSHMGKIHAIIDTVITLKYTWRTNLRAGKPIMLRSNKILANSHNIEINIATIITISGIAPKRKAI